MVRQVSIMLVLLAVATPLLGQTTGEERERQREVERLEAQRAALERARDAGVRILGRRCHVGLEGVTLGERVPADVG